MKWRGPQNLVRQRKLLAAPTQRQGAEEHAHYWKQLRLGRALLSNVQRVNLPTRTDISKGSFLHSGENLTYVLKTLGAPEKQRNFINEESLLSLPLVPPPFFQTGTKYSWQT